jgi:PadR family transcriptional regulator, regulatory protein PadR
MRRKAGDLIPIERSILEAACQLHREGIEEFHGIQLASMIKNQKEARLLTEYGTLYRALSRLEQRGLLKSRWEVLLPTDGNRPRHRYYRLVGEVETVQLLASVPIHKAKANEMLGFGGLRV